MFDRSEHEPEEWDPEEELNDPDSDSLTIPKVPTEDAGSGLGSDLRSEFESETAAEGVPAETDVPSELLQAFWAIVLVVNAAVLALSLGVILLVFEGPSTNSAALIVGGIVLFGFAGYRYRSYRASEHDEGASTDAETTGDGVQSAPGETPSEPESEHRSSDDPDRP